MFQLQNNLQKRMLQFSTLAFFTALPQGKTQVYKLAAPVQTFPSASNSVILSLAAYITWKFSNLPHPAYLEFRIQSNTDLMEFPISDLSLHPLYEAWCDLLCQSIYEGNARRVGNTLYFSVQVSNEYAERLETFQLQKQTYNQRVSTEKIFGLMQIQQSSGRKMPKIFLLNFATSQLRNNQLLPKIHLPGLLMGLFFDNQKWTCFCVLKDEIPKKSDLLEADALIFPGSGNSVLDEIEPVNQFIKQFMPAFEQNKKLKVLSICYGHQLISKLFSSKVVKKNRIQGHEKVVFEQENIRKYQFLSHILESNEDDWIMPEYHEDFVQYAPEGFDLLASSQSCSVQAIVKQDARILSLQFHPEYISQYINAFAKRSQLTNTHYQAGFAIGVEKDKLKRHHQACTLIRLCIKEFLASNPNLY